MSSPAGLPEPFLLILAGIVLLVPAWAWLGSRFQAVPEWHSSGGGSLVVRVLGGALLGALAVWATLNLMSMFGGGRFVDPIPSEVAWTVGSLSTHLLGWLVPLFLGGVAGAISTRAEWRAAGVAAWLGLVFLIAGFVLYGIEILLAATTLLSILFAGLILFAEIGGLGLLLCYQFYALEFLTGRGPVNRPGRGSIPAGETPRVAVQVASYNEPVDLVKGCLFSVLHLVHPPGKFHVQLLDDSTDPATCQELADFCRRVGVHYLHRGIRSGFKAGALNAGLRALPQDVKFVAIVDADYEVHPQFLSRTLGFFEDPRVSFVQTPQSYRNAETSPLTHLYALADSYFYRVVQPVRGQRGSAIFCGTMGVLRRSALERVGGWNESCITEDAELSLRLYGQGWTSVYTTEVLGNGLAPLTFEDLKAQHARWAFGGVQMLRQNGASLRSPYLTFRQKTDFLLGGAFWIDGIFLLGMASSLALIVAGGWMGIIIPSLSYGTLALIGSAPLLLLLDSVLKIRLALRPSQEIRSRDAIGVLGFWYAIKLNDLRAGLWGLFRHRMAFRRTPKTAPRVSGTWERRVRSLRATWLESSLALVFGSLAVGILTLALHPRVPDPIALPQVLLLGWILFYGAVFASAARLANGALSALASPHDGGAGSDIPPLKSGCPRMSRTFNSMEWVSLREAKGTPPR